MPAADAATWERDACLQLIMSQQIEPHLGHIAPTFVYDYPASQASLAQRLPTNPQLAARFEVYVQGIELANGFHELTDTQEQRRRFQDELQQRQRTGAHCPPLDEKFLAALAAGLPDCAGVALGVDRLLMLQTGATCIDEVLAFALPRL
jgi:lysyl-tRNA synthetase class 2